VRLEFHTLRYEGRVISLRAAPESFVNSKGRPDEDDTGQAAGVEAGGVRVAVLREGAEMWLRVVPARARERSVVRRK